MCDCGVKSACDNFLALAVHHAGIGGGLFCDRKEGRAVEPCRFRECDPFGERCAVGLQDQIDRELGARGIADPADPHLPRAENVEEGASGLDRRRPAGHQRRRTSLAHLRAGAGDRRLHERKACGFGALGDRRDLVAVRRS